MTTAHPAPPPQVTLAGAPVALVGLPGAGKTTVARRLAERLGRRAVDTDALVEAAAGRPVGAVFAAEGEAAFRARELTALRAALDDPGPAVIACGGGLVGIDAARHLLLRRCLVVWLDAPDGVLLGRLGSAADRPLLRDDPAASLGRLRAARTPLYAAAQVRVDVSDGDVEEICERVEDALAGSRIPLGAGGAGFPSTPEVPLLVELGDRSYPVVVGPGVCSEVAQHLPHGCRRVAVVADRAVLPVARRVLGGVRASGRRGSIIALRGGERLKTWGKAGRLVDRLARLGLERGDAVVAVGGGTVGDLAGFAAAVYLRGIVCVQVPTTLLAMVDSAVGGKTGVNLARGKNLVGAFWQPAAVLCDLDALRTLARRAHRAAFAEIVKSAMIADLPALTALLDSSLDALLERDEAATGQAVRECCALKGAVVGADERESSGRRALLNYGHTAGHALEAVTGYDVLLHGEAVAVGMRVAGRLSVACRGCPAEDVAWQDDRLARCGLGTLPAGVAPDPEAVLRRTGADKKARGGLARWVLLDRRGAASPGHEVPEAEVLSALRGALQR